MAYAGPVRRWDTFWADLEPGVGSEQRGERRPVIVISNDGYNRAFDVVTVLAVTKLEGKGRKPYTFEVLLPKGTITDKWATIVMPQQVRAISKRRLLEPIGTLTDEGYRAQIENRLLEHLDIAFETGDLLLDGINEGFARLRADPGEWDLELEERRSWAGA